MEVMVQFMQLPAMDRNAAATGSTDYPVIESSLREIFIEPSNSYSNEHNPFPTGSYIASMVQQAKSCKDTRNKSSLLIPTIGSQLRTLGIRLVQQGTNVPDNFFEKMSSVCNDDSDSDIGTCSPNNQLYRLHVQEFHAMDVAGLGHYLSTTTTLRELFVEVGMRAKFPVVRLLHGLRNNSSLYNVKVFDYRDTSILDDNQQRLVDAFCQRNRALADLLRHPQSLESPSLESTTPHLSSTEATSTNDATLGLPLTYPAVVQVAITSPSRLALSRLLGSFVPLEDDLGPCYDRGDRKRKSR